MKQKISFGARQFWALTGALAGVFIALSDKALPPLEEFAGGFAHALPARFSWTDLAAAFFWQLLPLLLTAFAGWLLFPRPFCTALTALRAGIGGYVCAGLWSVCGEKSAYTVIALLFVILFEVLTLLCMNSMARLAEMFSRAAREAVGKRAVMRYLRDQLFFTGIIFLLYLLRGCAVLLLA